MIQSQHVRFLLIALLTIITFVITGCAGGDAKQEALKATAIQIQRIVQDKLDLLDGDTAGASTGLSTVSLTGPEARQILNELYGKHPYIIDVAVTDAGGTMVTIAPDSYRSYEGTDISQQDCVITLNQTKKPLLSQVFKSVEGIDSVVIMWPVFSEKGALIGSVSALFRPDDLFLQELEPVIKDGAIEFNVQQTDGLIIYSSGGMETGKNLFSDPAYQSFKELIVLGKTIIAEESGSGYYTYPSHETGKQAKKQAVWVSAGLHGTNWRLITITESN